MKISHYWKAVVAAVVAGAGALSTALTDDTVTAAEGWAALLAVLGALGFTWAVPNKQAEPKEPTA
jgi:peptidoglycan/LPS O-acetylase OafA/YrhL